MDKLLRLHNAFHNTDTAIRAETGDVLTEAQVRRAEKALCCSDCQCGGLLNSSELGTGRHIEQALNGDGYVVC
jgi:hypothetical protein